MGKLIKADELKEGLIRCKLNRHAYNIVDEEISYITPVKAITLEKLIDFRNEVANMNSVAIIQRLDKLIEEVEDEK